MLHSQVLFLLLTWTTHSVTQMGTFSTELGYKPFTQELRSGFRAVVMLMDCGATHWDQDNLRAHSPALSDSLSGAGQEQIC